MSDAARLDWIITAISPTVKRITDKTPGISPGFFIWATERFDVRLWH
jgi:hypothetical protein